MININSILKENKIPEYNKYIINFYKSDSKKLNTSINLINDSYSSYWLDNTFCAFQSIINKECYILYSNNKKDIIIFDLIDFKIIQKIQNPHNNFITNLLYYLDKIKNKDLILSVSYDNNIKIWNFKNFECILDIKNINKNGYMNSACLFYNNKTNEYNILSSNTNFGNCEYIKIYNLNGNKMGEIKDSNNSTNFINIYYDSDLCKTYIITANDDCVRSYDFDKNEIYHKYSDNDNKSHYSIIINNKNGKNIKLIESSIDAIIRIWNFHSGELIDKIKIGNKCCAICLWNNNFLFTASRDIELIDLNSKKIISVLNNHNSDVITIKKFIHPKFGECLISQGVFYGEIKLWINKK